MNERSHNKQLKHFELLIRRAELALESIELGGALDLVDALCLLYRAHLFLTKGFNKKDLLSDELYQNIYQKNNSLFKSIKEFDRNFVKKSMKSASDRFLKEEGIEVDICSFFKQLLDDSEQYNYETILAEIKGIRTVLERLQDSFEEMDDTDDPLGFWRTFNVDSRLDLWLKLHKCLQFCHDKGQSCSDEIVDDTMKFADSYLKYLENQASDYMKASLEALKEEGVDVAIFEKYIKK